jgi:hypothetical protein
MHLQFAHLLGWSYYGCRFGLFWSYCSSWEMSSSLICLPSLFLVCFHSLRMRSSISCLFSHFNFHFLFLFCFISSHYFLRLDSVNHPLTLISLWIQRDQKFQFYWIFKNLYSSFNPIKFLFLFDIEWFLYRKEGSDR